jgi:hypothetical protein
MAAASGKSPPVFCGRRGILTAFLFSQVHAGPEVAIPKPPFWSAHEKEKPQSAQAR